MTLLQPVHKGSCMNNLERFYIQQHQYNNIFTPEQNSGEHNSQFEIACDIQHRHAGTWTKHTTVPDPN
jgi:hypothetical protein